MLERKTWDLVCLVLSSVGVQQRQGLVLSTVTHLAKKGSKGIPSSSWLRRKVAATQGMKGEGYKSMRPSSE